MHRSLEGALVRLRAREAADVEDSYRWRNDWEVIRFLARRYPASRASVARQIVEAEARFDSIVFLIETKADGHPIGWAGLRTTGPESRCADLGIAISEPDYRDGGYGTDAMRTACRFGFEMMNLHRIELTVYDWNERAIRVYEKVGFRHEARYRQAMWREGRYVDLLLMGLLKGELQ
jgi:RimJ/RimL family protein N-acetyltransferase